MRSRVESACFPVFVRGGNHSPLLSGPGRLAVGRGQLFSSGCWFHAILPPPIQSVFSGQTTPGIIFLACLAAGVLPCAACGAEESFRCQARQEEKFLTWFVSKKRIVLGWPGWRETNSRRKRVGPSRPRVSLVRTAGGSGSPRERIEGNKPIRPVSA